MTDPCPITEPADLLEVDTSLIDPDEMITIPLWRWHVLTCHSLRLRTLIEETPRDV